MSLWKMGERRGEKKASREAGVMNNNGWVNYKTISRAKHFTPLAVAHVEVIYIKRLYYVASQLCQTGTCSDRTILSTQVDYEK